MQQALETIFRIIPGNKIGIVETGTFYGIGTTKALYEAARNTGKTGKFVTIEVNPERQVVAENNLKGTGIQVWLGLSISRDLLPSIETIKEQFVAQADTQNGTVFYDHDPAMRAFNYTAETDFKDVPDNLLEKAISVVNPNIVLLDSAGHIGWEEFQKLLSILENTPENVNYPFYLVLDDTQHCKHAKTLVYLKSNDKWDVTFESSVRHGFAIAQYINI